jgi:hypothetical protein
LFETAALPRGDDLSIAAFALEQRRGSLLGT